VTTPNDLEGIFWLPDHRDKAVAGHVLFTPGKIRLQLHGGLPGFSGELGTTYTLMLGIADSSTFLTLYRAYTSGAQIGEVIAQRLSIGLVFSGAHFSEDELSFSELKFNTDHLADWAALSGIVYTDPAPKGLRWQVGFGHPEPVAADLADQGIVKLEYDGRMRGQRGSVELSESPRIFAAVPNVTGHRQLLSQFLDPLRDLLTFATMSPAYLEDVVLTSPNATHTLPSGTVHQVDIDLWHTLLQPEDRDRVVDRLYPSGMLFTLADWPSDFSSLVRAWLDIRRRHQSSMNLLMGLAYAPPRWEETRVLTLAQALEAYHRTGFNKSAAPLAGRERKARVLKSVKPAISLEDRAWLRSKLDHAEEPSHRERIYECASRIATIIDPMLKDLEGFCGALSKVRHTYSHLGAGTSSGESARRDHELGRRAYWVLVSNYLLDLRFTEEQARSLVVRNRVFQRDLIPEWIDL